MNIETNNFLVVSPRQADANVVGSRFSKEIIDSHKHLFVKGRQDQIILGRDIPFLFRFIGEVKLETAKKGFRGVTLREEEFESRSKDIISMVEMFNPIHEDQKIDEDAYRLNLIVIGYEDCIPAVFELLVKHVVDRFPIHEINRASHTISFGTYCRAMGSIHFAYMNLLNREIENFRGAIITKETFESRKEDIFDFISV